MINFDNFFALKRGLSGKNRRFLSIFGQFGDTIKFFFLVNLYLFCKNVLKTIQIWFCYAGIVYGLHIDTFMVNICAKMGHFKLLG
jgi:hypothetical protein